MKQSTLVVKREDKTKNSTTRAKTGRTDIGKKIAEQKWEQAVGWVKLVRKEVTAI